MRRSLIQLALNLHGLRIVFIWFHMLDETGKIPFSWLMHVRQLKKISYTYFIIYLFIQHYKYQLSKERLFLNKALVKRKLKRWKGKELEEDLNMWYKED